MKVGIGTYSFMWAIGFEGARPAHPMSAISLLDEAVRLSESVVQFGPNLGLQSLPEERRREVVQIAQELGLELELGTKGLDPGHLAEMARLTRSCGASLLRTVPAEKPSGAQMSVAEMETALREVLPILDGENVTLAIENALVPARALRLLIETLGSPKVGITLDTVNSLAISEGVREVAEMLAPYTRCLHVKDFAVVREWHMMGFRVEGRPAGQGQLDLPWLLGLLQSCGARANAVIELWVPEQSSLDATIALERQWAEQSAAYLKRIIEE